MSSYDYSPSALPPTNHTVRRPDYNIKLVVVGDGGCGKTCLLTFYAENRFPTDYVPTVFENLVTTVPSPLDPNKTVELSLWDTAGQEDFDRLRPLSYNETNVVLVVFAVNARNSYLNVTDKWHPEISHFCPNIPVILVLTKTDIRNSAREKNQLQSQGQTFVSYEEGMALAKEIGAKKFMECSAKDGTGVKEVFDAAMREALKGMSIPGWKGGVRRRKKGCVVL